jgi:EAL domain-containing protein (putative c-di-GMP-specific phosphodiesterase class I)
MTETLKKQLILEAEIRKGIDQDEFVVHYQPIVDGSKGEMIGLEALVRWEHPQKGLIAPEEFLAIAESSSLIIPLGESILKRVVRDVIRWHHDGFDPGYIAVNMSIKQLSHNRLTRIIREALSAVEFRTDWLEIEITENYMLQKADRAFRLLNAIKSMGVKITIDDFGTGYSSLSYLKRLPIDKIKIDRSFIEDVPVNVDDEILVRAIIAMGESLGLTVIAEGVEADRQKKLLIQRGCTLMQGFYFAQALPPDELFRPVSHHQAQAH